MFNAPLLDESARESLRQASAALDAAERQGNAFGLSQACAQVAHSHMLIGAWSSAEAYMELALRWVGASGSTDATVDVLCDLCNAAERVAHAQDGHRAGSGHAARDRARDHAFEAARLAGRVTDADWEIKVLLRISEVLDRCGDRDDAVNMQARALRLMAGPAADAVNPHLMPGLGRLADQ